MKNTEAKQVINKLKCPFCKKDFEGRIACFSEDFASVYEITCPHCKKFDSCYIGATTWEYNRSEALLQAEAFDKKWGLVNE